MRTTYTPMDRCDADQSLFFPCAGLCHGAAWLLLYVQTKDSFEFYATEHFRMSGVYWGLTAMHLLGKQHMMDTAAITDWVLSCQHTNGGFGGSERHDPHLLYTLSAVQILGLCDALHRINKEHVAQCAPPQTHAHLHVFMEI